MDTLEFEGLTTATFSVDMERRTMRGVVIPWGKIGRHSNGNRWRFARGSLKYGHEKYIKLNEEHVQSARFGRAIVAEDTDEGFVVTFKVYDGPQGDRALAMARDGRKTGLSPEVDIDTLDMQDDPENPGVRLVTMANLTAVGFVKNPAFDDSRLISVVASYEGASMKCTKCGLVHADGVTECVTPPANTPPTPQPTAQSVTFSADQFNELMAKLGSAGTPESRPTVVPPAPPATTKVTEPLPYQFSHEAGGKYNFRTDAEYDFSTDLFRVMKFRDPKNTEHADLMEIAAAEKRIDGLIRAAFADVDTTDVADINPTRHRPDMWQPQMDYATPLWDMVASGPTDGTKFDVPKYNSSSGLVGPATEKTEPAGGDMAVTLQTITPTQVWGKVEITRQAWRAGGSPQLSGILWEQMLREYYEDRENAVATFLATLTAATDITLPGVDASPDNTEYLANVAALEAAIADLQFVRGGNRFRAFAVHQALYRVLAKVTDTAGRPLYPIINPQNANGTSQALFSYIDIAGTRAVPSWALGSAGGDSSVNSWLFDPAKVRGWAGAPERMFWDFGATVQTANIPQLSYVTLGIYGDVAFANLDINGVRQVIFDQNTAA